MKLSSVVPIIFAVMPLLQLSCANDKLKRHESIRIGWGRANKERFAYVVVPVKSNSCEVAIVADNEVLEKSIVQRPFPDLVRLAQTAKDEIGRLKHTRLSQTGEVRRLVVNYQNRSSSRQSFSLTGDIEDVLRVFEESRALRELLAVTSRNQPKDYRILDVPGPHKAMGNQ